ncbi:coproporphyrinogen III oxidase [Clostridium liquoris]|uniref:Coproporphyrinogen III oxidase n=1 Tax=Clostridium liquoris TaxID=1289519 RepID=A0A2T0B8B9_9CLOT|nr:radical SAM protein [Clostridium liquoris]PRR80138.1 coproporphyrinogen III oxidase [Clostridium liquoris]
MEYEGIVYRPPSEAYSLIIQVTIGCAHNKCSFCSMYKNKKFRIRSLKEIFHDLEEGKNYYRRIDKIFLADGDALCLPTDHLKSILIKIKELFPQCNRVGIYATPKDILRKSLEDLQELRELGLGIIYMGLESGSEEILKDINKGVTQKEMIEAGKKVKKSGIPLSLTVISGIGGKDKLYNHGVETGKVISEINPDFIGLLTLMLEPGTEITDKVASGEFNLLTPEEVMLETKVLLQNTEVTNCIFRSNHASNYVSLKGTLPFDKDKLIHTIDEILKEGYNYKSELYRGL